MTDEERIRMHLEIEFEGATSPAQLSPISAELIAEVEKLATADLIDVMRHVRERSKSMNEMSRERFAKRFETLSLEAAAACAWMRRHRASDDVPECWREMGTNNF